MPNRQQKQEVTVTPNHSATIKNHTSERFLATKMKITSIENDADAMLPPTLNHRKTNHLNQNDELRSINIHYEKSFLLLDGREELRVSSSELFAKRLGCPIDTKMKVVSIFGNTGDGKSHTMNHIFFGGEEIFSTSAAQDSCTLGVWAAFQPTLGILCLDTEGLLGATTNENQRMRLLLKVLAISDIAIFRTRSERLHSDMFTFLGTASKAFYKHFAGALQSFGLPGPPTSLGPAVVVFHETRNTKIINSSKCDAFTKPIPNAEFQIRFLWKLIVNFSQLSIKVLRTYYESDSHKWTLIWKHFHRCGTSAFRHSIHQPTTTPFEMQSIQK